MTSADVPSSWMKSLLGNCRTLECLAEILSKSQDSFEPTGAGQAHKSAREYPKCAILRAI